MIKGQTKSGFKYEIEEKRLENYELMEVISKVDSQPLLLPKVIDLLLGEDADKLKDHVRDEDGIVSAEKLFGEIEEIFASQTQVKN
ncbi:hypothetical protein ACWOA0_05865 [Ignavigranum ruoffiae]|uniref:Phage XkdN-like tail assembly chaperone protein, TAC n=1 Tax=Ignavigranum ruoffiae TaxID=89093 RepID=A0A1H9BSS0_9LACT|nr:hypothetical protein [Ignavigranum ruoffiae]SEP92010.1 hypothetical protein SAMN04488558_10391 [Ignavigranum ruoffiae]